ncbi:MAG: hypothetical protein AB8F78_09450 [Saprospiraceae bacterium]
MFYLYGFLILIALGTIIALEFYMFGKLNNALEFPRWRDYLTAMVPIPILGGLFWTFIVQLNRTQRQLLVTSKHIHQIKYIEGLLLATNSLSTDINDSIKRVNNAIDQLLENHLNTNLSGDSLNEQAIIKEENKDTVPIDTVIKLLKEAKGIIK